MRQFYEVYRHDAKVSALLRQLPWTQNLIILNQYLGKLDFYLEPLDRNVRKPHENPMKTHSRP